MSLTHTFNLIGSMMKPSFDPGSGNNIPAGTNYARTTPSGETTWDSNNLATNSRSWGTARQGLIPGFSNATSQTYLRMEKTANGMEINFVTPDPNVFPADQDSWFNTSNQAQFPLSPNVEYKLYENNNVSFDAFKFVRTAQELDNPSGLAALPLDSLRAPGATSVTTYDSHQTPPWFSVTNTGDKAAYELFCYSFRDSADSGVGSTQNGANRIIEFWGRAQGYADTLLVTYTIQAYAEAVITS